MLLLLLMLGAFLAQSIATQSHLHFRGLAPSLGAYAQSASADDQTRPQDSATLLADCPLCDALAMAGHYVVPPPVSLFEQLLPLPWLFAVPAAYLLCRTRSHRWQSRAPPQ